MEVNRYDQDEKNTSFSYSNYKRGLEYIKKYKAKLFIVFIVVFTFYHIGKFAASFLKIIIISDQTSFYQILH